MAVTPEVEEAGTQNKKARSKEASKTERGKRTKQKNAAADLISLDKPRRKEEGLCLRLNAEELITMLRYEKRRGMGLPGLLLKTIHMYARLVPMLINSIPCERHSCQHLAAACCAVASYTAIYRQDDESSSSSHLPPTSFRLGVGRCRQHPRCCNRRPQRVPSLKLVVQLHQCNRLLMSSKLRMRELRQMHQSKRQG
eukprot:scaffold2714_cov89-Skeletonema_dohrnii-CCMP3373.AAC.1